MKDYISLGPTPCEEPCAQVGQPNYRQRALKECVRFIQLLRQTFGPEPEGACLSVTWFPHDFGDYAEVVCYYHTDIQASVQLAVMTHGGERGIVCQMLIAPDSLPHLRTFTHPLTPSIRRALLPLLDHPPAVTMTLRWDRVSSAWVSTILKGGG